MAVTKAASLADDLVALFEGQIDRGELAPGARFPTEMTITEQFGVSRTVVREAFARLAARGLLVSRRGSGAYVAEGARFRAFQLMPDEVAAVDDVLKLLEMRTPLEVEMAGLAAERASEEDLASIRAALLAMDESEDVDGSIAADAAFHASLARATGNSYYVRFTDFLGIRLVPSRKLYLQAHDPAQHRFYARTINVDHEAIYAAVAARDVAAARQAAQHHMRTSANRYHAVRRSD